MLTLFQTLMSALKILTTVAKGTQLVQIPKDPSLALVILDSLGMDQTAQVIQVNQRKFPTVSTSKTHTATCTKGYFFGARRISYYNIRGGVFSWFRSLCRTHAFDSPNFNFTCIIFFSWQWITFVTVFSFFFFWMSTLKIPSSQFLQLFRSCILFPPTSTFCLNINKEGSWRYGVLILFQTLMSAIKILTAVARGTPLAQILRDHSSALVSLDSLEIGRNAEVKSLKA